MQIWVDADACPRPVKELLYRAAERRQIRVTFVSGQWLTVPESAWIVRKTVAAGFDAADQWIVAQVTAGDLVITADIPLADEIVALGAIGLNPRGEWYTPDTIGGHRSTRDLLASFRDAGMEMSGPPPWSPRDRQAFANALDQYLSRHHPSQD